MKILAYAELESKESLLPLMDHAFGWPLNPRAFEKSIKIDPRLRSSAIGFCAVENGHVVGFVGVMDLATRNLDGNVEYVGGVYGVATLPSHVRKGISTTLMNRAHEYFRERGYRFSFLTTSHTIVAHSMYVKLGYSDLWERPTAYKILESKRIKPVAKEKARKIDYDRLLRIYNRCVKDKTGFVVRDKSHLVMFKKFEGFSGKECIVGEDGYVLFKASFGGPWVKATLIRELVAANEKEMSRLVGLVEARAKDIVLDRTVMNDSLLNVYRSRGYTTQNRSHGVMMIKPLTADASFKLTYGDKFHLTGLDFF